ncbi:MAG: hypothetical protein ACM3S3_03595 [Candidatus Doudnabacteria bacterium]|jgi:hypothetical protein
MVRGHASAGIAFAVGLAAAISIYAVATVLPDGESGGQGGSAPGGGLDAGAAPLAAGTRVSLNEAVASVSFAVPRPNVDLASDASIAQVWVRTSWDPEVLIQYASGVRVEVRRSPFTGTPEDFYKAQVAEGVPGEVVAIKGVNVFIVPQGGEGNLGSATIVVNGLLVMIVGDGIFSVDQLQALATSVLESASAAQTG